MCVHRRASFLDHGHYRDLALNIVIEQRHYVAELAPQAEEAKVFHSVSQVRLDNVALLEFGDISAAVEVESQVLAHSASDLDVLKQRALVKLGGGLVVHVFAFVLYRVVYARNRNAIGPPVFVDDQDEALVRRLESRGYNDRFGVVSRLLACPP